MVSEEIMQLNHSINSRMTRITSIIRLRSPRHPRTMAMRCITAPINSIGSITTSFSSPLLRLRLRLRSRRIQARLR